MRKSSTERIRAVFESWHAAFGLREFSSAELLKAIGGAAVRNPKIKAFSDAVHALYSRSKPNVIKLGRWLAQHRGVECGGLRLLGEYSTDRKLWTWHVEPVPTKAELRAEGEALDFAISQRDEAIAEKARRGRTTLTAEVDAIVAVDKFYKKRTAALAAENAKAEQREAQKAAREAAKNPAPIPARPERAFTIVAPKWGCFTTQRDAERRLPNFARFTATARVAPWLVGFAIVLDTEALEERGKPFDDLYAAADFLMLEVEHHRDAAPQSGDVVSFWPVGNQYVGSLVETDPFALVEREQKGRSVIPRGALDFII